MGGTWKGNIQHSTPTGVISLALEVPPYSLKTDNVHFKVSKPTRSGCTGPDIPFGNDQKPSNGIPM